MRKKKYYDLGREGTPQYELAFNFMIMEGLFNQVKEDTEKLDKFINSDQYTKSILDSGVTESLKTSIFDSKEEFNTRYSQFCKDAEKYKKLWNYCTAEIYIQNFPNFEKKYFDKIRGGSRTDFLKYEINALSKKGNRDIFTHEFDIGYTLQIELEEILFEEHLANIEYEKSKKIDFLKEEIYNEGYATSVENNKIVLNKIDKALGEVQVGIKKEKSTTSKITVTKYPIDIFFNQEGFNLFQFLDENYAEKFKKAKYINIFHFLVYNENILICTQLEYINFIQQTRNVKISKITPTTYKYSESTLPKLKNLKLLFEETR